MAKYDQRMYEKASKYLGQYRDLGDKTPIYAGLASYLGVSLRTVRNWGDSWPEFRDILDKIKTEQERVLWNNGLDGTFNSNIVRMGLMNNHGYAEKQSSEISGPEGGDLVVRVLRKNFAGSDATDD